MPLPGNFSTVPVHGKYVDLAGAALAGTVTFTATPDALTDPAALIIVMRKPLVVTLDVNGEFTTNLPATDDPDIDPIGFTYKVVESFPGRDVDGREYYITVPVASLPGGIDLTTAAPAVPVDGVARGQFLHDLADVDTTGAVTDSPLVLDSSGEWVAGPALSATYQRKGQLIDVELMSGSDLGAKIMAAAQLAVANPTLYKGIKYVGGDATLTSIVDFRTLTSFPVVGWIQGFTIDLGDALLTDGTGGSGDVFLNFTPPTGKQFLVSTLRLGTILGNTAYTSRWGSLAFNKWNNSRIYAQAVTTGGSHGVIVDNTGSYGGDSSDVGTFNNDIRINQIGQNVGYGFIVAGRVNTSPFGFQGNTVHIGDVISNGSNGVGLGTGTAQNAMFNKFLLGAVEHNGTAGILDNCGLNHWIVGNTNNNGTNGFVFGASAVGDGTHKQPYVSGYFTDGINLNTQTIAGPGNLYA